MPIKLTAYDTKGENITFMIVPVNERTIKLFIIINQTILKTDHLLLRHSGASQYGEPTIESFCS